MVHGAQHTIGIWWEVDAHNFGRLVAYDIEESGILVSEPVVILSPDCRGKEDIEGGNCLSPGNFFTLLEPLGVLVDHRVNDVNEWLVTVDETMTTAQQVTFEPA